MTLNMFANISPMTAGGDELAGKYEKNLKRPQRDRRRKACAIGLCGEYKPHRARHTQERSRSCYA